MFSMVNVQIVSLSEKHTGLNFAVMIKSVKEYQSNYWATCHGLLINSIAHIVVVFIN